MRTTRKLDVDKLRSCPQELIAVVSNIDTGKAEFVDLRTAPDPIKVLDGGITIPGLSTDPYVTLENGMRIADGGVTDNLPLEEMFNRGYTDIVILANAPLDFFRNFSHQLQEDAVAVITRNKNYGYPRAFTSALKSFRQRMVDKSRYAGSFLWPKEERGNTIYPTTNPEKQVALLVPENNLVQILDTDKEKLVRCQNDAAKFAREVFTLGPREAYDLQPKPKPRPVDY